MATGWVWSERFLDQGELRSPGQDLWGPERLRVIADAVSASGLGLQPLTPRPATTAEILTVHTEEYVRVIQDYSSGAVDRGDDFRHVNADTTIASNTYELAALATGSGTRNAVDAVMAGTVSSTVVLTRPGDHHAYPARGEGFCIFNHTAIGARYLQKAYGIEPGDDR